MSLKVQVVPVTPYQQNCSIIQCQATGFAAIVDPGGDIERIEAAISQMDATVEKILLTHGHLDHFIAVRMVHERAGLHQVELVDEGLSWWDTGVTQTAHAVHAGRQDHTVPVDRRRFRQLVGHVNAYSVAFDRLDCRAMHLPVVAPAPGNKTRRELVLYLLGDQVIDLDAIDVPVGKGAAVWRRHGPEASLRCVGGYLLVGAFLRPCRPALCAE